MNKILKLLIALLVCWIIAFCVSFYTASDTLDMVERVLYSLLFASIAIIVYSLSPTGNTAPKNSAQNAKSTRTLYVFEREFGKKLIYRIQDNKVYEGFSNRYYYEIKGDKIYKALSTKWDFQIKGNRIYRGFDKKVAYRLVGNKVYAGEFERTAVFRISYSKNG